MRLTPTALGAKGVLFFAAVVLLFFATPYSNLFFLLTAFLAVLGAVGVRGTLCNVSAVKSASIAIDPAPAGSDHVVALRLDAGTRKAFLLRPVLEIDGERVPLDVVPLAAGAATHDLRLPARARGLHRATSLRLRSAWPFGLCSAERRFAVDAEVVTHPRPETVEEATARARAGDGHVPPTGDDRGIAGLREWRHGDGLRDVHWRATARLGSPVVKEYERLGGNGSSVVIDRRTPQEVLELDLSRATRAVLDAASHKRTLRLASQGAVLVLEGDRPDALPLLRWLAGATTLPADAPPPPLPDEEVRRV